MRKYKGGNHHYDARMRLWISRNGTLLDCWRFEKSYCKLDGVYLHAEWATGEGEVVRHMCCDNKCVNPMHLVRGSDLENAMDEIYMRDYSVEFLSNMIGEDYSKLEKDLAIRILLPRVCRKKREMFRTTSDVARYAREFYRKAFVKDLIGRELSEAATKVLNAKLNYLVHHPQIDIIWS